ncbi:MAG TPA: 30S ribosomal protein S7 [Bacteroidetes bacterium]|jgi:small subunit ribosomal protein S7|nr:30S ribosomal protein S7 [Bacteroidota bacterium]
MRKKHASKRIAISDPKFGDLLVNRFINNIMKDGKKHRAQTILYDAIEIIGERAKTQTPIDIFKKAVHNVSPVIEIRARRVGGATYQVPTEVRPERRTALAIRWLINYSQERSDKSMSLKLAAEFIAAANGEGNAVKKKEDTHRMAEANKAFAHFKW